MLYFIYVQIYFCIEESLESVQCYDITRMVLSHSRKQLNAVQTSGDSAMTASHKQ